MKKYQCRKCFRIVDSASSPQSGNCATGGSHHWNAMGDCGKQNYECRKCNEIVEMAVQPQSGDCSKGGSHHWHKL